MDFELSKTEGDLAEKVEALLADEQAVRELAPGRTGVLARAWFARLGEIGYLAQGVGAGRRFELLGLLVAQKILATRAGWLVFASELQRLVASLVADLGSDAQRAELLDGLTSGRRVAAVAFSEQDRPLSAAGLATRAEPQGDGFCLTGQKDFVSLAAACDLLAVLAATDQGPAVLLVDRGADGVELGAARDSFGYPELATAPVTLKGVHVPAGRCLGPLGESPARDPAEALRQAEDRLATACSLGLLDLCVAEAKQAANAPRPAGKPPAGHQLVRFELAEMLTLAQTAELLALRAAAAEAAARPEAGRLSLCAKVFATEAACRVSDQALGILSAAGYRRDHPVARAVAEARFGVLAGHSSHLARMAIADEALARLARD